MHKIALFEAGPAVAEGDFGAALAAGLGSRPKSLPSKFFYDATGARLFEEICELPEYYPTRTETALLASRAGDIATVIGPGAALIEFGAGAARKVRLLLDALARPAAFLPIDISGEHLREAAAALAQDYPTLAVLPVAADYTQPFLLPRLPAGARRIGFFPGSTIGNFTPAEARQFLRSTALLLKGGGLLVGVDLVKDPAILHAAYNDAAGVTAAFNLNLLARANRELGTDFDLAGFRHYAFFNPQASRVEMHLVSVRAQRVRFGVQQFDFAEGESIHTENSCKYTVASFQALAGAAGFRPAAVWCDPDRLFSLHWLEAPA